MRSGAGSEMSGARHHESASFWGNVDEREGFAAEKAIPEKA